VPPVPRAVGSVTWLLTPGLVLVEYQLYVYKALGLAISATRSILFGEHADKLVLVTLTVGCELIVTVTPVDALE
jgi:hypothetical protein